MVNFAFAENAANDSLILSWAAITAAETGNTVEQVLRTLYETISEELAA